jgi:hypothetical protein
MPSWAEQRITAASEAQLATWLDGIFDATGVEDLLGTQRERIGATMTDAELRELVASLAVAQSQD